jgi:hypothetical protein
VAGRFVRFVYSAEPVERMERLGERLAVLVNRRRT